jgi:hypothetical protein
MGTTRTDPPFAADELTMLRTWLDYQRDTLAFKCDDLTPEQLCERSVPPSSLSLIGLVRHMDEVERGWFQRTFAGRDAPPITYDHDTNIDGDFDDVAPELCAADRARWDATCDESRRIVDAATSLDQAGENLDGDVITMRWILVHMIEEYARHNGHADLLRERIDGATGD